MKLSTIYTTVTKDTVHKRAKHYALCHFGEFNYVLCHYGQCHYAVCVILLSLNMLCIIMLSVITPSVTLSYFYVKCRNAKC
jgi:hypothetical protein